MVRGRQLDPSLRARIFELRATGYGAKKIHKILPDIPFNTIKTTLRRSKTGTATATATSTPTALAHGSTSSGPRFHHPGSHSDDDDTPSPSPGGLDPHRDGVIPDPNSNVPHHPTSLTNVLSAGGPLNNRVIPGAQQTPVQPPPQQHPQQQQQPQGQQPLPPLAPQHQQHHQQHHQQEHQPHPHHQQQHQHQHQQQQQQQQQQHQQQQQRGVATPNDAAARARARDLLNEILPPGSGNSTAPGPGIAGGRPTGGPGGAVAVNGPHTPNATALDLDRLKAEYRAMPDAQRAAAESELDLRKAALVSVRWEARRELEAARRAAQLEQLQALQQEGLDPETFYLRFRELVATPVGPPGVP